MQQSYHQPFDMEYGTNIDADISESWMTSECIWHVKIEVQDDAKIDESRYKPNNSYLQGLTGHRLSALHRCISRTFVAKTSFYI